MELKDGECIISEGYGNFSIAKKVVIEHSGKQASTKIEFLGPVYS